MSVGVKRRPRDSATIFCEAKKSRRVLHFRIIYNIRPKGVYNKKALPAIAPARVVRELDSREIAMIGKSAEIYVENAARFSSDLFARV